MTNATPAAPTAAAVDDMARRLVSQDVCYCVSALVSTLAAREWDGSDGIDPDDLYRLAARQPDADDYREAAREAGVFDTPASAGSPDLTRISVTAGEGVWYYATTDADGDPADEGQGYDETEAGAWRAGFDSMGLDHPDGSEVFEHWLVTDDLARRLEARGEAIAHDVAGLTIWGRATTGQAIYMDAIMQDVARDILAA